MWAFFTIALVLVCAAIVALLRRYAARTVPWVVLLATAYAWLTSMSIVVITPLDVETTLTKSPSKALGVLWQIAYWSTQVLTWLLMPFFQVYADAGDFTVGARCLTSLKENGILYGAAGAAGAVGLVVIVIAQHGLHLTDLMALGMGLSNTFGLAAGILLMGYGLVEIPRHLWKSDPEQLLKWCAHRAGRYSEEVLKSTNELETVVTIVCANQRQMPRRDPLRPYMEIIAAYAEEESPVKPSSVQQRQLDIEQLAADDLEYNYDKAGLAALRRRLARAIHEYKGAHAQYEEVICQAMDLEAIIKCRQLGVYDPPPSAATALGSSATGMALSRAYWQYRCAFEPMLRRIAGVLMMLVTLTIIWCEATIFTGVNPDLSPFSLLIRASSRHDPFLCQLLALLPLAYVCASTFFALFRINAFNYNKLLPRATTGAALMQNGSLAARFAAPMCWNFLHMIHMDGNVDGETTVFQANFGTMALLPVLGKHLNMYLPLLLVVHCTLIWLRLWDRLAGACVSSKYRFTDDDVNDEFTERGRQLVKKEAEALANNMRIGDILHSSVVDLEFPSLMGHRRVRAGAKKKGWFNFGRKAEDAGAGAAAVDIGTAKTSERSPLFGGARSAAVTSADDEESGKRGSLLSSLVRNKYTTSPSPQSSDSEGGKGAAGGLDGIFAGLGASNSSGRRTTRN